MERLFDRDTKLGEIEGVFWDVRAKLSGVFQEVSILMKKVDMGLSMAMRLGRHGSDSLPHVSGKLLPKAGRKVSARVEYKEKGLVVVIGNGLDVMTGNGLVSGGANWPLTSSPLRDVCP